MDPVDAFAEEVRRFDAWVTRDVRDGEAGARAALERVLGLYAAALRLPPCWSEGLDGNADDRVSDDEWTAATASLSRLPLDMYGEVFDPLVVPPEEPGLGSLVDDLADMYRDVVSGLRLYAVGKRDEAVWAWAFAFRTHWGRHASGAIRALHAWLASEAPAGLGASKNPTAKPSYARVRAATTADIPALGVLYRELDELHRSHHPELFPGVIVREPGAIEAMLADQRVGFLVAELPEAERAVVGFVRVVETQTPDHGVLLPRRFGLVDELAVAPEHRRVGVASALLEAVDAWARERGIGALEVTVWGFNHDAQDLYVNHGYSVLRHYFRKRLAP